MFVLPTMRDRAKRSMRRRGRRAPSERLDVRAAEIGVVAARPFSAPPIPSRRARKERFISSPDLPADGASTGSWPAHISKPSPLRSTAPAGPAASHRTTSPDCHAPNCRRHGIATAGGAARIAQLYCCRNVLGVRRRRAGSGQAIRPMGS